MAMVNYEQAAGPGATDTLTFTTTKPTDLLGLWLYNAHATVASVVTVSIIPSGGASQALGAFTINPGETVCLGRDELLSLEVGGALVVLIVGGGNLHTTISFQGAGAGVLS